MCYHEVCRLSTGVAHCWIYCLKLNDLFKNKCNRALYNCKEYYEDSRKLKQTEDNNAPPLLSLQRTFQQTKVTHIERLMYLHPRRSTFVRWEVYVSTTAQGLNHMYACSCTLLIVYTWGALNMTPRLITGSSQTAATSGHAWNWSHFCLFFWIYTVSSRPTVCLEHNVFHHLSELAEAQKREA